MSIDELLRNLWVARSEEKFAAIVKDLIRTNYNYKNNKNLRNLLKKSVDVERPVDLFAGVNQLASVDGKKPISEYLKCAGSSFSRILSNSLCQDIKIREVPAEDNVLEVNKNNELVCLGGPVANRLGGVHTEYNYFMLHNNSFLPVFAPSKLRWGFFVGDSEYGSLLGDQLKAKRCEGGLVVDRPRYAFIDKDSKNIREYFKINDDGFLCEEVLIITKVINSANHDNSALVIGGTHGYSISAFGSDEEILRSNFKEIHKIITRAQAKEYQIFLPVKLTHKVDHEGEKGVTIAELKWDRHQFEKFS